MISWEIIQTLLMLCLPLIPTILYFSLLRRVKSLEGTPDLGETRERVVPFPIRYLSEIMKFDLHGISLDRETLRILAEMVSNSREKQFPLELDLSGLSPEDLEANGIPPGHPLYEYLEQPGNVR